MSKKKLVVKKLDETNLSDVMSLQEKIISGLNPDEQHFILHRTEEDYMNFLKAVAQEYLTENMILAEDDLHENSA